MRYIYLGKRIRIGTCLPAAAYLYAALKGAGPALSVICALLVHEAGHAAAAAACGRKFDALTLTLQGADLSYGGVTSYGADMAVCAAGPFFNLITAALFRVFPDFAAASLFYGLLNLVPAPCFDGGRVLRAALLRRLGTTADRICAAAELASLFALYLFSVFVLFYTGANATLLIVCAYVFAVSYMR